MLDLALKNVFRQRTRTFLTVLGVVIGITAVISLGSISEGINLMMQNNLELVAGRIMVFEGEAGEGLAGLMTGIGTSEITDEQIETIISVLGIKDVVPLLVYMERKGMMFEAEWFVFGINPKNIDYFKGENIRMYDGRELEEGDSEVTIIGKDVANKYNLEVGDYFTVKDMEFEIVGIIERSNTQDIDKAVIVPIQDLQDLLDISTYHMVYVIPEDVTEVEEVAEQIEDADENLYTITSKGIARQASQMIGQITIFTIGMGAIAAVVGGLGVMNTMIMAVLERRREIGVMKAIGATRVLILKQFLLESATISMIGGSVGIMLGVLGSFVLTIYANGTITMVVTPILAIGGLLFALCLGLVGGIYPAFKASKLEPVEVLRYE